MITLRNVSAKYLLKSNEELPVLDRISISMPSDSITCIIGPSGCGKTTLLNLIAGILKPNEGTISIEEINIYRIGFVFQTPTLLMWKSVLGNISIVHNPFEYQKDVVKEKVLKYLGIVGLKGWENSYPHELSLGMQTRINIARALSIEPNILLLDEPFSHLDEITAERIRSEIADILRDAKATTVFVTHNLREAIYFADNIYVLSDRPAKLLENIKVTLTEPRNYYNSDFIELEKHLLNILKAKNDK